MEIIELKNIKSLGLIATIHFPNEAKPAIGMTFTNKGKDYEITGVIFSSGEHFLKERYQKNVFDCRIKEIVR